MILSIDPHKRFMACALIHETREQVEETFTVEAKPSAGEELMKFWARWARVQYPRYDIHTVVIEVPDHLKSKSNKQLVDLADICLNIGAMIAGFYDSHLSVELLQPRTWKGSKSKATTDQEVRTVTGRRLMTIHESDAAAMGLWWVRRSKASKIIAGA